MQSNSGDVPNQFEITTDKGTFFQSYRSIIAYIDKETWQVYLDEVYWNYSNTTGKYRNQFLREDRKDTEKKIKSWEYLLCNLNK